MAKKSNQKLKALYVLEIVKKYSDDEHPLNASEIVKHRESEGMSAERKRITFFEDDLSVSEVSAEEIFHHDKGFI